MNKDEMYEEFGTKKDYPEKIVCDGCSVTIGFTSSNLDAVTETVSILCKICKGRLQP